MCWCACSCVGQPGGCGGLLCQYSIHGRVLGHVDSQNVFCGLDVEPKPNNGQRGACKKERKRKGLISRPICTPRRKRTCPSSQPQPVSIPNTDANRDQYSAVYGPVRTTETFGRRFWSSAANRQQPMGKQSDSKGPEGLQP